MSAAIWAPLSDTDCVEEGIVARLFAEVAVVESDCVADEEDTSLGSGGLCFCLQILGLYHFVFECLELLLFGSTRVTFSCVSTSTSGSSGVPFPLLALRLRNPASHILCKGRTEMTLDVCDHILASLKVVYYVTELFVDGIQASCVWLNHKLGLEGQLKTGFLSI